MFFPSYRLGLIVVAILFLTLEENASAAITVRNLEWPSIYGTDRPIPFFRKFRITCPPRAVKLMTLRSGKEPREKPSRKDTMDRRIPTAGKENQQRRRTVHHQTS